MGARLPRFGAPTPTIAACLCGRQATARNEAGRYFCAEHLPRRAPPPTPRPAPVPAPTSPAPRQGDLFGSA